MNAINTVSGLEFQEDGTAICLARITADDGTGAATGVDGEGNWVKQADLTSITCDVFKLDNTTTPDTAVLSPTVTISSAIQDTPVTARTLWTVDFHGWNFKFTIPYTAFATPGKYRVEMYFVSTGGARWWMAFEGTAPQRRGGWGMVFIVCCQWDVQELWSIVGPWETDWMPLDLLLVVLAICVAGVLVEFLQPLAFPWAPRRFRMPGQAHHRPDTRPSRSNGNLYNEGAWRDPVNGLRVQVLRDFNYLCQECLKKGIVNAEKPHVHHIKDHCGNRELFLDRNNLTVLCEAHHNALTASRKAR
jgi:hypothetical protein